MSNPRELAADQDGVVSSVRGGIDLVSSRLTMPSQNSPDLVNVEILRDGSVAKRRGARRELIVSQINNNYPASYHAFNTLEGFPIVLCATNRALLVTCYPLSESSLEDNVQRLAFVGRFNVFRSGAPVDYTVIREPGRITRVLMTQQDTTPIQMSVFEQADREQIVDGGTTANRWYAPELDGVISTTYTTYNNFIFYGDGLPYTVSVTARYDTATQSVVVPDNAFASAPWVGSGVPVQRLTMIWATLQWWTEAIKLEGSQIVGRSVQGTTIPADRLVTVPLDVLSGVSSISDDTTFPSYPITVHTTSAPGSALTYANPPNAASNYTFSNGSIDVSSRVPRSPLFVVTGAPPNAPRTLLFSRGYEIPFLNGAGGFSSSNLRVFEVPSTSTRRNAWQVWNQTSPAKAYNMRSDAYTISPTGKYITFDALNLADVSADSQYVIVQRIPNGTGTYFGTNATPPNFLTEGSSWVTFGITNYSTYGNRQSHPRTSCLWQGRLVLAGWKDDPLRVAVSGVEDNALTNWYYNDFQLLLAAGKPSDSFDFSVPVSNDDYITAVSEFQGRLFIFTRDRLFQMVQTESGVVVRLIGNVGAANAACVTEMEGTLVFMGSQGVYVIEPTRDEFDYRAVSISDNIRPLFERYGTEYGWVAYSPQHQYLFVSFGNYYEEWLSSVKGTPTQSISDLRFNTPTQLYVYNAFNASWTKWTGLNADTFDNQGGCVVRRDDTTTTLVYSTAYLADPCNITDIQSREYLQWEWGKNNRYVDTFAYGFGAGLLGAFALIRPPGFQWTARDNEREVFVDREHNLAIPTSEASNSTLLGGGFRMCPVIDIEDVAVFPYPTNALPYPQLSNKTLKLNQHYYKTGHNSIVLADNYFETNRVMVLMGKRDSNGNWKLPFAFWVDDRLVDVPINTSAGGSYFVNNPPVTRKYEIGMCYPSWYSSPHWYRQGISYKKRVHTFAGYYHNDTTRITRQTVGSNPNDLIGSQQTDHNFTLALAFSDEQTGDVSYDVYGAEDLTWDYSNLDIDSPSQQNNTYARIMVPVYGGGYNIQVWNYNQAPSTWRLVGYELRSRTKQGRGINNTTD